MPVEKFELVEALEKSLDEARMEVHKWKNRATCWEKAARNAQSRYDRLKASIEALWDRYAQCMAEETLTSKLAEARDAKQAEGTTGSPI